MEQVIKFAKNEKYKIILLVVLLLLLLVINSSAFFQGFKKTKSLSKATVKMKEKITPTPTSTPIPTPTPTEVIVPTKIPNTPTPVSNNNSSINLQSFFYPGASVKTQSGNSATLTSGDSTDAITNWYSQKIQALGMSNRTTIRTQTNGNVNNKISGANGTFSVQISVTKSSSDSLATINISL